jgi:hypothetical protein
MAVIGRVLEAQGFRVGILSQPDWHSAEPFKALGKPNLFWAVTAGNMDSMINRYTADRKLRSDDAYTPGDGGGQAAGPRRPSSTASAAAKRSRTCPSSSAASRAACAASRTSTTGRRRCATASCSTPSATCCCTATPNARSWRVAHRLARREPVENITGRARHRLRAPLHARGLVGIDSTSVDTPGRVEEHVSPYMTIADQAKAKGQSCAKEEGAGAAAAQALQFVPNPRVKLNRERTGHPPALLRSGQVGSRSSMPTPTACCTWRPTRATPARWCRRTASATCGSTPPPIPLTTAEMDHVFGLPYARAPHPVYGKAKIPAWEMIRFSVNIMRGCFGGCTFCSITEHEGRIIQSRSEESILHEIEEIRDKVEGFTGVVSDLGGPTANMYRLGCRSPEIEAPAASPAACSRASART